MKHSRFHTCVNQAPSVIVHESRKRKLLLFELRTSQEAHVSPSLFYHDLVFDAIARFKNIRLDPNGKIFQSS